MRAHILTMAGMVPSLVKIYELSLIVSCTLCFSYQLYTLFDEYSSGRTIINIEINQDHYDTLPAITVCPAGLALDKVALLNDQLKTIYDKYLNDSDLPGKETYDKMEEILMKMVNDGQYSLRDIFNNFTYQYNGNENKSNVKIWLGQVAKENGQIDTNEEGELELIPHPLESIIIDIKPYIHKCFTFFTHHDRQWKQFKVFNLKVGF